MYTDLVECGRLQQDSSQLDAAHVLDSLSASTDCGTNGVYLWGSVGSGKSMLMDMLFNSAKGSPVRLHFHELMVEVHQSMHELQMARPRTVVYTEQGLPMYRFGEVPTASTTNDTGSGRCLPVRMHRLNEVEHEDAGIEGKPQDVERAEPTRSTPLQHACKAIASRASLLCLDEMQVTDVADAMILRQLFEGLFSCGVQVVFTSNRPPEQLYERGLNRKYFLPFVSLLHERCRVQRVGGMGVDAVDYRSLPPATQRHEVMRMHADSSPTLVERPRGMFAHGDDAEASLLLHWERATGRRLTEDLYPCTNIAVAFGRTLSLRHHHGDTCWMSFDELCGQRPGKTSLGAADYLALGSSMKRIFLSGLPVLELKHRDEARRLITLIDALYEAKVELNVSAAARLDTILAAFLADEHGTTAFPGAEVAVSLANQPSSRDAPVGGQYRANGELATVFTAKDEAFMIRRMRSRMSEMCYELER